MGDKEWDWEGEMEGEAVEEAEGVGGAGEKEVVALAAREGERVGEALSLAVLATPGEPEPAEERVALALVKRLWVGARDAVGERDPLPNEPDALEVKEGVRETLAVREGLAETEGVPVPARAGVGVMVGDPVREDVEQRDSDGVPEGVTPAPMEAVAWRASEGEALPVAQRV